MTPTVPTPPRPRQRVADVVVLRGSQESIEGEVIAVLADTRYKVKWATGLSYRDRGMTVAADDVRKTS